MNTVIIQLPAEIDIKRAGHIVRVDLQAMSADIIAQLVMHGATQKIGDAAAGKEGDDALNAMKATHDALCNGDWGRARTGSADPDWFPYAMAVVRENLSADNKALYKDAEDAKERQAFLRGLFDGLDDAKKTRVTEMAQNRLATAKAEKAAARALGSDLGL